MNSVAPSPPGTRLPFFEPQKHDRIPDEYSARSLPARPTIYPTTMASSLSEGRSLDAGPQAPVEITAWQKMLSATSGSLVTGLISTPLDVVRVRWQSQGLVTPVSPSSSAAAPATEFSRLTLSSPNAFRPASLGITACCREVFFNNNLEACVVDGPRMGSLGGGGGSATSGGAGGPEQCAAEHHRQRTFNSTLDGLRKIARNEGVTTLWRGLSPTLMMAIPGNIIYFTGYEWLRADARSPIRRAFSDAYSPLVAGATARVLAATTVGPIELFRTRMQAVPHARTGSAGARSRIVSETFRGIRDMVRVSGYTALWRGLTLTMWRDVPFSGLYWWGYEFVRGKLTDLRQGAGPRLGSGHHHQIEAVGDINLDSDAEGHMGDAIWHNSSEDRYRARRYSQSHENHAETFTDAFVAGALSGSFASLVTTPFDVGKTRTQVYRDAPAVGAVTTTTTTTGAAAAGPESPPSSSRGIPSSATAARATPAAARPERRGMVYLLWHILRHEGLPGLFTGVIPRMLKVAPACAIMISSYELGKRTFRGQNERAALQQRGRETGGA